MNPSPECRQSGSCAVLARRLTGAKTDCPWNGDVLGGKMFNPSRARFSVFVRLHDGCRVGDNLVLFEKETLLQEAKILDS